MADEKSPGAGAPLPPKLNLKKELAVPKPAEPAAPAPQPTPAATPVPAPAAPAPAAQPTPVLKTQPTAKAVGDSPGASGTTMHIEVPEAKPADGLSPKTVKIKRPAALGTSTPATAKPAPAPLGAKPAQLGTKPAPLGAAAGVAPAGGATKKDTSKIPLEAASATGGSDGGAAPKTIRIKPTAAPSTIKIGQPSGGAAPAAAGGGLTDKSKTSRISLEAALGAGDGEAPAGAGPKTIRLKRPSEAATIKLAQKPSLSKVPTAAAAMDKTARLDEAEAAEGGESATQRKTIRVKRPTKTAGVKPTIAVKRKPGAAAAAGGDGGEGGKAAARAAAAAAPAPRHDEPGVVWSVFTIMAILVVGTVIWMFMSQGIGPNSCMTQYSYAPLWKNLPWPGKLRRERNFVRVDLGKLEPGMAPPAEGAGGDAFGGDDFGGDAGFGDEFSDEAAPADDGGGEAAPAEGGGEALDELAL